MRFDTQGNIWQIGIVARTLGNECALAGVPGLYTWPTAFLDWIAATMSSPPQEQPGMLDGDPSTVAQLDVNDPTEAAIRLSRVRWPQPDNGIPGPVRWVVLSRDDDFPDSLAAASLASIGPLLFTRTGSLTPATHQV